ncbi:MAG: pyruvate kinase [Acholeplasmataceae bacterium]
MRKTKIVCTLGPVSENKETMTKLVKAGMNVARFNFSHGDYEEHGKRLKTIREINKELNTNVATMLDTKGPEIRTHEFDGKVLIKKDSEVIIGFEEVLGNAKRFSVTYPGLYDDMKEGDLITVDDGYLSLLVTKKDVAKRELVTKALNSHTVKSRRGVNVPNVILNMPFISTKDADDIKFAAEMKFDFVAASFVRRLQDVLDVRTILDANGGKDVQIISKIENQEGVDNIEEIVKVSDGIMVARGDLGIEVPAELVPIYQTTMINECLSAGKTVIVATQMLESMQHNPRPTRAEVSDVFNAVREGTSATMLSGESAAGDYPEESVLFMSNIDKTAESTLDYEEFLEGFYIDETKEGALALSAAKLVLEYDINLVLAHGKEVARKLSNFHPNAVIVTIVKDELEARSLALNYGVVPVLSLKDAEKLIDSFDLDDEYYLELTSDSFNLVEF